MQWRKRLIGDRDRGTGNIAADPGQSHFAPRCILYLCLRKLREKRYLNAHLENAERAGCNPQQFRLGRGHCPHHDTKIRNGQPAVPTGARMGTAGAETVLADHVQLGAAGNGGASATGV